MLQFWKSKASPWKGEAARAGWPFRKGLKGEGFPLFGGLQKKWRNIGVVGPQAPGASLLFKLAL